MGVAPYPDHERKMIMNDDDDPRQTPYRYRTPGGLVYVWHGGPYIDVCTMDEDGELLPTDRCLNVWDYQKDQATIDRTRRAFLALVAEDQDSETPIAVTGYPVPVLTEGYSCCWEEQYGDWSP